MEGPALGGRFALLHLMARAPMAALLPEGIFVPHGRPGPAVVLRERTGEHRLGSVGRIEDIVVDHAQLDLARGSEGWRTVARLSPLDERPLEERRVVPNPARSSRWAWAGLQQPELPFLPGLAEDEGLFALPPWRHHTPQFRAAPDRYGPQLEFALRELLPRLHPGFRPTDISVAPRRAVKRPPGDGSKSRHGWDPGAMIPFLIPPPGLFFRSPDLFRLRVARNGLDVIGGRWIVSPGREHLVWEDTPVFDIGSYAQWVDAGLERLKHQSAAPPSPAPKEDPTGTEEARARAKKLEQAIQEATGFAPAEDSSGRWLYKGADLALLVPKGGSRLWVVQEVARYGIERAGVAYVFPACLVGLPCPEEGKSGVDIEPLCVLQPTNYPHPYVFQDNRICLGGTRVVDSLTGQPPSNRVDAVREALRTGVLVLTRGIHSMNTNTEARSWDGVAARLQRMSPQAAAAAGIPLFPYHYYEAGSRR